MRFTILASASALALSAYASGAAAQTAQASPTVTAAADEASADLLVVTGSRIARANLDASVPVTTLSAAEIQTTGDLSLGDSLNLLPQFRPTYST